MNLNEQTWDLVIGALKGTLNDKEQREFDAWIAEADNRLFFENLTRAWHGIQQHAAAYEPDRDRLWEQLQQRIGVVEAPHPVVAKRNWRPLLQTAAAVAAAIVVTLFTARPDVFRSSSAPVEQQLYAFEGKSQARLADGSTVWLHGGSTLTYDTHFDGKSRHVKLSGEGFFEVAKDPKRPFTVEIEGLKVRVDGTKFNVRNSHDDNTISVSLVEGSVALDPGTGIQQMLRPGEIAYYDNTSHKLSIMHGNVAMESCWAADKLTFERQSLGDICRYMSRWYDTEIRISPALARNYAYTFTITNEPLEEILRIMSRINPIVYTFSKENVATISELE